MEVHCGHVVGLAGLLGSGRTETLKILFGADHPDQGAVPFRSIRSAIRGGFGLCSEDRKAEGILPELSVRENMMLVMQTQLGWFRRISAKRQNELALNFIERLGIKTPDSEKPIGQLSGGNQQKVLLARWLLANPRLLMLDEPTRGIDIGAKFEIMSLVEELRSQGMGFVFVSSELSEVVRACDRVYVLRDRKMVGQCDVTEEAILAAIAGPGGS
jgi:simple sugar transport system ATP-binding protein